MIVLRSGVRLNQTAYIEECLTPLIDDLLKSLLLEDAILYQGKAPCHADQRRQKFLKQTLPLFIRTERLSPSLPDLNVMDYQIWPSVKQQLNRVKNFDDLKTALMKIWSDMPVRVARGCCTEWMPRLRRVIRANGLNIFK